MEIIGCEKLNHFAHSTNFSNVHAYIALNSYSVGPRVQLIMLADGLSACCGMKPTYTFKQRFTKVQLDAVPTVRSLEAT